jgi:predicted nucleic acid-binding protein
LKRVFVDTGGFVGVLVPEDANHARAKELFEWAQEEGWRLTITNSVVVETYSTLLARARNGRLGALTFIDSLVGSKVWVERVRVADEKRALEIVRKHDDKLYSLCDAQSFVVMERLGITEVIAFDRHFREYGPSLFFDPAVGLAVRLRRPAKCVQNVSRIAGRSSCGGGGGGCGGCGH